MWLMLQQSKPDDYVLATGVAHSVRKFVERAFAEIGVVLEWRGTGLEEKGSCAATDRVFVEIDPRYFRPTEVDRLVGDPTKARKKLGWNHDIGFDALICEMVREDLKVMAVEPIAKGS
jgi:GDPmannose 4,6-dehydratase